MKTQEVMKCECIKNIEERMIGQEWKGRKVTKAEVQSLLTLFPKMERITCSSIHVVLEGRKGKQDIEMTHNFCPFCGVKIKDEESNPGDAETSSA